MTDRQSRPLFLSAPGNEDFTERLATASAGTVGAVTVHTFPDGESLVRIDTAPASRDIVIVSTFRRPNEQTLPLIFLADTARELGARRVGLVAPYLPYMRQDTRFHAGEAITSRSFARLLSRAVDWLITVEPHLHRFAALDEVYTIPTTAVHVTRELARWIADNVRAPFLIGPDAESRQWVEGIARAASAPFTVLTKQRRGDTDVIESIPELGDHRSRTPVLVDDIISTGTTMVAALRHLGEIKTPPPLCVAVHAVFAADAHAQLLAAGASRIVTTNTIAHASNGIDVVPAVSEALARSRPHE
jgi:ribose-phosphate pyrophosphokinase